jgi:hypothetical protein
VILLPAARLDTFVVNQPLEAVVSHIMSDIPDDDGAHLPLPWEPRAEGVLPGSFHDPQYGTVRMEWHFLRHERYVDFVARFYVPDGRLHGIHVGSGAPAKIRLVPLAPGATEVRIIWAPFSDPECDLKDKLLEVKQKLLTWSGRSPGCGMAPDDTETTGQQPRQAKARVRDHKLGPHGGTLARVLDARRLIEQGEKKTRACKKAGIDTRTYDRYLVEALDWETEPKPPVELPE